MEVVEKREIVHEYENENKEYASKGVAGAGLGLGIAGTALGLLSMNGKGLFGLGSNASDTCVGPTSFQAWEKACNAELTDQKNLYDFALGMQNIRFNDRQTVNTEMFGIYKNQRDGFDVLKSQIDDLKIQIAVDSAIRPYQNRLVQCEIDKAYTAGINYTDRRTCRMITGEVVLPSTPVISGYGSYPNLCGCPASV